LTTCPPGLYLSEISWVGLDFLGVKMTTKTLDNKGRITLGAQFAGQTVVVDDSNPDYILIKPVVMIPAGEAWLYKNKTALNRVREGLDDVRSGVLSDSPPDVEADMDWLDDVKD